MSNTLLPSSLFSSSQIYFFNSTAVAGDTFFNSFVQYNGNYPGFPGYFVIEGNMMFGASIIDGNRIIKLQSEAVSG